MFLRHIQSLLRQPAFSAPALLTIALGIGVTTAVCSLAYAILLRPFPYTDPDRLVRVYTILSREQNAERNCSLLDVEEYNRRARLTENFGAYTVFDSQIEGGGSAQAVVVGQLNQEALHALAVSPALGRLFTAEEDRKGGPVHKAILSHALWQTRYGADPAIVGKTIQSPMTTFEVVGVMPSGFAFPDRSDIWLPMESYYTLRPAFQKQRDQRTYATIARLKPGVSLEQAQAEMDQVAAQLEAEYPRDNSGVRVKLKPLREATVGSIRPYVLLVLSGVALVLVISIVNVTSLLLVKMLARQKQYAIQAALGASRWQLAREFLIESLTLAVAGGLFGAGLAWGIVQGFQNLLPDSIPVWMLVEVDAATLGLCFAVALASGLAMGFAPAWIGSRTNLDTALKQGTRGSSSATGLRSALVVAEVALSLLLMVGAGLLVKTFLALQRADHGFEADNLIIARVSNSRWGSGGRVERAGQLSNYHVEMQQRLARIPGVRNVAAAGSLPYTGSETRRGRVRIQGHSEEELRFMLPVAGADVAPGFFQTMKIPLIKGRYFERTDTPEAPPVMIINETAAKALFGDQDPIDRMLQWGDTVGPTNPYCRIVGVVRDVKWEAGQNDTIELYYPFTQWPVGTAFYMIRTGSPLASMASQIRRIIQEADDRAAVVWIKSMNARIDEALWQRRLWGALFTAFATLALLLAAVGLYGVLAYSVSQRTREIGIRLAVGARPSAVRTMVMASAMKLVLIGLACGSAASFAALRLVTSLVDSGAVRDWTIYAAIATILVATGVLAAAGPAIRASRVDPLVALRDE